MSRRHREPDFFYKYEPIFLGDIRFACHAWQADKRREYWRADAND